MGAWHYVAPRLREVLGRDANLHYIGRPEFASPAEGSLRQHTAIQAHILESAIAEVVDKAAVEGRLDRQLQITGVQHAG